ncbi:MAG: siphovirus Gp157 family protein [Cyanophyceae cyanobacterium]
MSTLFEISQDLTALMEGLESFIEHPEDQEQAIQEWFLQLEAAERARDDKLDSYCALIKELDARIGARKAEGQRLLGRVKVDERLRQCLKNNLQYFFEKQSLKTVDTRRFKVSLCATGGHPPVNLSVMPEDLPLKYQIVTVKADTSAIRDALQRGESVSGASLAERGRHIRIS